MTTQKVCQRYSLGSIMYTFSPSNITPSQKLLNFLYWEQLTLVEMEGVEPSSKMFVMQPNSIPETKVKINSIAKTITRNV